MSSTTKRSRTVFATTLALVLPLAGCFRTTQLLESPDGGAEAGVSGATRSGAGSGGSSARPTLGAEPPEPFDPSSCARGGLCTEVEATNIDKLDLLFVVDNSSSMQAEQAALFAQLPRMLERLASGDRDGDGSPDVPAVKDMHLGVVSSDLGLPGISDFVNCANLGDDGILLSTPHLTDCDESYPRFLSFSSFIDRTDELAHDFACLATLGTDGCGFVQPLEAALKALWPASDSRITFVPDVNGVGVRGHGDEDNREFLRNDPVTGISLIAVVVLSDDDDCSTKDPLFLRPALYLDPHRPADAPLLDQGLKVRCQLNPDHLFAATRYVNALRELRPGRPELVVFAAIAGVPPDIFEPRALMQDQVVSPAAPSDALYARIENHPRMQPVLDRHDTDDVADDTIASSCSTGDGEALPPTRLVEVAKSFGSNGVVRSICDGDLAPALDAVVDTITPNLGAPCLSERLIRDADGLVPCDVIWELPKEAQLIGSAPTKCSDQSFLSPLRAPATQRTSTGGARCRVAQRAVIVPPSGGIATVVTSSDPSSGGWFYDDFSSEAASECPRLTASRIAFTPEAKPPTGVRVVLDCAPSATP